MAGGLSAFGTYVTMDGIEIGKCTNISGPTIKRTSIDVTHHRSPDEWMEKIKGIKDGGQVTLSINYDPTNATHNYASGLLSDFDEDTDISTFAIVFPDLAATTFTFPGFVVSWTQTAPTDGKLNADVTLEVAGKPTLA